MIGRLLKRLIGRAEAPATPVAIDSAAWQSVIARLPAREWLRPDEVERLRQLASSFLAAKQFFGAHGLALDDDMLLSIAAQACLPILNRGLEAYRGWVGVVVYPGEFIVPRAEIDDAGVLHEYDDVVLGEAWQGGPVLIGWFDDAPAEADAHAPSADTDAAPDDYAPINVVIHEFAHKLDMENGEVDGLPRLPPGMSRQAWARDFTTAFERFCAEVDRGEDTRIDPYASDSPAEFFAVCSEVFFMAPWVLHDDLPEVYRQLTGFYGLDPVARLQEETA